MNLCAYVKGTVDIYCTKRHSVQNCIDGKVFALNVIFIWSLITALREQKHI